MFQNLALFPSSGKETPNLVDLLDQATASGQKKAVNVLRYAPDNRPSPRVVKGK
jgi:hypothetical protein